MSEENKKKASQRFKNYWEKNKHKLIGDNNVSRREEVRAKLRLTSGGSNNGMYGKVGELSSFYGKKHSKESISKISNSRKGKCMGDSNPSKREDVKEKIRQSKIKYWKNKKTNI